MKIKHIGTRTAVLQLRTTWRCGKMERLIIGHLIRRGKQRVSDIIKDLAPPTEEKRDSMLDAIKRLESRYIISIE